MPQRKTGPLERQLLKHAQRRVRREHGADHGEQVLFANAIKKPQSWVSAYLDGHRYPNLDTSLRIAAYCEFSFPELAGEVPLERRLSAGARRVAQWFEEVPTDAQPALSQLVKSYVKPGRDQQRTEPRAADPHQKARKSFGRKRGA